MADLKTIKANLDFLTSLVSELQQLMRDVKEEGSDAARKKLAEYQKQCEEIKDLQDIIDPKKPDSEYMGIVEEKLNDLETAINIRMHQFLPLVIPAFERERAALERKTYELVLDIDNKNDPTLQGKTNTLNEAFLNLKQIQRLLKTPQIGRRLQEVRAMFLEELGKVQLVERSLQPQNEPPKAVGKGAPSKQRATSEELAQLKREWEERQNPSTQAPPPTIGKGGPASESSSSTTRNATFTHSLATIRYNRNNDEEEVNENPELPNRHEWQAQQDKLRAQHGNPEPKAAPKKNEGKRAVVFDVEGNTSEIIEELDAKIKKRLENKEGAATEAPRKPGILKKPQ